MFLNRIRKLPRTLSFRLTVWYATIFLVSAIVAFVLFYMLINSVIRERTDRELVKQANEMAGLYRSQGLDLVRRVAGLNAQAAGEKKAFFRLIYPSGIVFATSNLSYWRHIGVDRRAVDDLFKGRSHVLATHPGGPDTPAARIIYRRMGAAAILQLGYSMESETRLLEAFRKIFIVTMSSLLILAVAVGGFMARRALAGVAVVTRTARRISEGDLHTRVPVQHRGEEVDQLALTFNQMLDRIQSLISGVRQMNDNIAHDLRSPITRIRGLAEVTLSGDSRQRDFTDMAGSTIEECDRLLDMINTMLTISRTEAGVNPLKRVPVALDELVQNACALFQPLAEDRQIRLQCRCETALKTAGDRRMLQRMVANLIDNGVKFTPQAGKVDVVLCLASSGQAEIRIQDTGPGIAEDEHEKIFERFYRSDASRSAGGTGLGLSLARAVARAHGGDIGVRCPAGGGCVFTINLPCDPLTPAT